MKKINEVKTILHFQNKDYIHKTTKPILDKYNIILGNDGRYF